MKVTKPGFVYQSVSSYSGPTDFLWFEFDCEMDGYVLVCPYELSFELPEDFDLQSHKIKALKDKKQKATADFQLLVTQIDRQISELTAIEFDGVLP